MSPTVLPGSLTAMYRLSPITFALVFSSLLAGCTLNNIRPLPTGSFVAERRAIVVYGIGVEGKWNTPRFSVKLEEYNLETQAATGNCLHFNRMEATVPPTPGPTKYFAFDVPPGSYVYSAFHSTQFACGAQCDTPNGTQAFKAPEGEIVYVGDFIYSQDNKVRLRRDLEAFKNAAGKSLPDLRGDIALAKTATVRRPGIFICGP